MKAIRIDKSETGQTADLVDVPESELPPGEVLVRVEYSTLNYKDGLAITGKGPVVRRFPMVPGIDFAGVVEASEDERYAVGERVVLNGWGVGETHWGGLAQKARVSGDWLIPLPKAFSSRQAMAIGTAGYTAMLCVMALEKHGVSPGDGEILVTGASGGVGSVAIALLAKRGYKVVALSGRSQSPDYFTRLGASSVVDRAEFTEPGKPLQKERWAGAIDVVGGRVLANICAQVRYGGVVAACGLAGGADLPATVMPFILRGVTLRGVDSVMCPRPERLEAWSRLADELDPAALDSLTHEIGLEEAIATAGLLLDSKIQGRVVVRVP